MVRMELKTYIYIRAPNHFQKLAPLGVLNHACLTVCTWRPAPAAHTGRLRRQLQQAWQADQRVRALKIVIQVRHSLSSSLTSPHVSHGTSVHVIWGCGGHQFVLVLSLLYVLGGTHRCSWGSELTKNICLNEGYRLGES